MKGKTTLLVVIGLLLSIGSIYYLTIGSNFTKEKVIDIRFTKIDTSDLQNYTNEEYGFSLNFPPDWEYYDEIQLISESNVEHLITFYKDDPNKSFNDNRPVFASISIDKMHRQNHTSIQELMNKSYYLCLRDEKVSDTGCAKPEDVSTWIRFDLQGKEAYRSGIIDSIVDYEALYILFDDYFIVLKGFYYNQEAYNFTSIYESILESIKINS